jgi:hypothetical protein
MLRATGPSSPCEVSSLWTAALGWLGSRSRDRKREGSFVFANGVNTRSGDRDP